MVAAAAARAGGILTIDLAAVAENYRRLREEVLTAPACAAVVKADGYGLGAARVGPVLARAGARSFFVAQLDEGIALRAALSAYPMSAIFVLNGPTPGAEDDFPEHGLVPVLNSLGDIETWSAFADRCERPLPAALHVDTGMSRLGLPPVELGVLASEPDRLASLLPALTMSHLACAEQPDHPLNARQLADFRSALARLPRTPRSLANSSGIFLGHQYHFDLGRPGVALFGVNPTPGKPSPMQQVVRLQGRILQCREIDAPQTVGYGAAFRASGPTRVATVAVGYADGFMRHLSNRGTAWVGGRKVPVVGRISMDLTTLDVTAVPAGQVRPGALVDFIGPEHDIDALAQEAGTIGYEILTALGRRYHRVYLNGPAAAAGAG